MTTRNPVGFCPNCKQNVLLVRKDINWPLAIMLLIFTAGIGLVIYLIIYYGQVEDRCIHCHSQISISQIDSSYTTNIERNQKLTNQISEKVQIKFCPFCGEALKDSKAQFCSNCGAKV